MTDSEKIILRVYDEELIDTEADAAWGQVARPKSKAMALTSKRLNLRTGRVAQVVRAHR